MARYVKPVPVRAIYDPESEGADCKRCPLRRPGAAVPSVIGSRARLIVIGEGPGANEEQQGKPFVGESGRRLDLICKHEGVDREADLAICNATACRPVSKLSERDWRTAIACCLPRLRADLARAPQATWALLLGRRALGAFTGITDPVIHWVGTEVAETDGPRRGIVSVHPAFALRGEPAWISVFYRIFARAWAFASETATPSEWPELTYDPTPATLRALQAIRAQAYREGSPVAFDVETAGVSPSDPLTAVGLADLDRAVSTPWPPRRWYPKRLAAQILAEIKAILASPRIPKVAHNGIYDLSSLKAHGLPIANYAGDTILAHQTVAPALPHRLQIAYALEYGGEAWKTLFHALGDEKGSERFAKALETEKTRQELCSYNAKDCAATIRLHHAMSEALDAMPSGNRIYQGYLRRSLISLKMRDAGAKANLPQLAEHDRELSARLSASRAVIVQAAADAGWEGSRKAPAAIREAERLRIKIATVEAILAKPSRKGVKAAAVRARREATLEALFVDLAMAEREALIPPEPQPFNPGSGKHLADLFFRRLGCAPIAYSESTGAPSLDTKTLHHYLLDPSPVVRSVAREVVSYRRWQKLLRTYVQALAYDQETGLIHADPKVWGTKTGRWSYGSTGNSFNPQTLPKPKWGKDEKGAKILIAPGLRNLVCPRAPENWIVEADYSQLEARIVAFLAADTKLLDVFASGVDLHSWTAEALFGPSAVGSKPHREQAKRGRYAWQYGAEPLTAWKALVVEIPGLQLRDVEKLWERLNRLHPAIVKYHQDSLRQARILDYVETPLSGRRFYFFGNVEPSKVYNLPVQGTGADLIDSAIEGVAREIDWATEWILFQVHDSLICEGKDPVRLCKILQKHMARPIFLHGKRIIFPIDFKISPKDWGSVEECHSLDDVRAMVAAHASGAR